MKPAYLWAIERVDAEGEPAPHGEFVKLGLRRPGEVSALIIDRLDAEALGDCIRAIMAGQPLPGELEPLRCEACGKPVAEGAKAYQARPGGGRCLICEACAPTVSQETSGILQLLELGTTPKGFTGRSEARAWVSRVRGMYHGQVKRLSPVASRPLPPLESDLEFKEPPASARVIEEEDKTDD